MQTHKLTAASLPLIFLSLCLVHCSAASKAFQTFPDYTSGKKQKGGWVLTNCLSWEGSAPSERDKRERDGLIICYYDFTCVKECVVLLFDQQVSLWHNKVFSVCYCASLPQGQHLISKCKKPDDTFRVCNIKITLNLNKDSRRRRVHPCMNR